ncbi:polyketide synthase dehydratase domain-containing protein [Streptomyces sp. NRRL F-5635]|uniref:polyketide synthase dehydratase domain-containing protein n=1 Tax=Streptomyces sp. NRRL F-5635 TaxID=1463865 RepID=UPI00099BF185
MRRERPEVHTLLNSVGHIWRWGLKVDWPAVFKNTGAHQTDLPTYAFQHRPYWLTPRISTHTGTGTGTGSALGIEPTTHPLLAGTLEIPSTGALVLTGHLDTTQHPWLNDHQIHDQTVLPGTALVDLCIAAGDRAGCPVLDELVIQTHPDTSGPARHPTDRRRSSRPRRPTTPHRPQPHSNTMDPPRHRHPQ